MKRAKPLTLIVLAAAAGFSTSGFAAEVAPPAAVAPATQPADPKVRALIDKLADDDPKVRESVTQQLREMGREALPALKEQADSENPEIRSRVRTLIRQAERRLPPAAPPRNGFAHAHSTSVSINNGRKTINVDDNGYKIRIEQDEQGIKMNVTGVENGREVTETYAAKDADQLKRENPEAFALYEKYNSRGGTIRIVGNGGWQGNVQIQIGGNGNGGVWVAPGQPGGPIGPGGGPMFRRPFRPDFQPQQPLPEDAQKRIEEKLQNIPEDQKPIMRQILEQAERQQLDVQAQVEQQLEQAKRKAIDDLKVPDREEKKEEKKDEKK